MVFLKCNVHFVFGNNSVTAQWAGVNATRTGPATQKVAARQKHYAHFF